jgi:hypothetical protein
MTEQNDDLRDLHAHLETKCQELCARVSAMIDHAGAGDGTTFIKAMVRESLTAVEFWTGNIVMKVERKAGKSHG